MSPDAKHLLGAIAMWLGVILAALAVLLLLPRSPTLGAASAIASALIALLGAWFKKRHCPKCRQGVCEVEGERRR
ncbi:hypothetical protein JXA47_06500 [Candidatus Sumerlaeota bacterium]|nr:hypothetical protein [Candidatus Sumerlaeota bacterium]